MLKIMKKIILLVGILCSLVCSMRSECYGEFASKEIVNDSTILLYNVDKIDIMQPINCHTYIVDIESNNMVADVKGDSSLVLGMGNYLLIARRKIDKVDVSTKVLSKIIY